MRPAVPQNPLILHSGQTVGKHSVLTKCARVKESGELDLFCV